MSVSDRIRNCLNQHVGETDAITIGQLYRFVDDGTLTSYGQLRDILHRLRQDGELIASSGRGYFRPASLQEALDYVDRQFRRPARDQFYTARVQRDAAKAKFGQQLELFNAR